MPKPGPIARLSVAALAVVAAAGCGGSDPPDARDEIVRVLDTARDHVLGGRAREACELLTPHGRERSLGYGRAYEDTKTCEAALGYLIATERDPRVESRDFELLERAEFEVERIEGSDALVTARAGSDEAVIGLRKTPAGWRIHDSDAVPVGD
ncbi:MAG TPA: hypothetical protein VF712_13665 [Thermoleophilaceae bacterium]